MHVCVVLCMCGWYPYPQVRSTATSLQDLQGSVKASLESGVKSRLEQVEAREKMVVEFERSSREAQLRAEDECRRLQVLLGSMESAMRELQKQVSARASVFTLPDTHTSPHT